MGCIAGVQKFSQKLREGDKTLEAACTLLVKLLVLWPASPFFQVFFSQRLLPFLTFLSFTSVQTYSFLPVDRSHAHICLYHAFQHHFYPPRTCSAVLSCQRFGIAPQ